MQRETNFSYKSHETSCSTWSSQTFDVVVSFFVTNVSTEKAFEEEIINEMEKEQDAIVVRLLREIETLKEENSRLKNQLHHPVPARRSSPFFEGESAILDDDDCNYGYTLDTPKLKLTDGASRHTVLPLTPKDSMTHISHSARRSSRNASISNGTSISDTIFPIETKIHSAPTTNRNLPPPIFHITLFFHVL